jgi:protein-tyrosine phosphatase
MTLRVLVVCTANVCRSPMAEALLQQHCARRGVDAVVTSAGTLAAGLPVDPLSVAVMGDQGLDISHHQPRRLQRAVLERDGADLVLTMTRDHLRMAATTATGVFPRAFTLREFSRRVAITQPRAGHGLGAWLAAVGEVRKARDLLGDDPADDIADPYGASLELHRLCAVEIDQHTDTVARALAWMTRPRS